MKSSGLATQDHPRTRALANREISGYSGAEHEVEYLLSRDRQHMHEGKKRDPYNIAYRFTMQNSIHLPIYVKEKMVTTGAGGVELPHHQDLQPFSGPVKFIAYSKPGAEEVAGSFDVAINDVDAIVYKVTFAFVKKQTPKFNIVQSTVNTPFVIKVEQPGPNATQLNVAEVSFSITYRV